MKIVYPISAALPGGALHDFDYELRMNSDLEITKVSDNVEITGQVPLTIDQAVLVLDNGGNVYDYLMAVKLPIANLTTDVPSTLPDSTKPTASGTEPRQFNDWLAPNNVWVNDTHFYFLTQTVAKTVLNGTQIAELATVEGIEYLLTTDTEFTDIQNA